MQKSIPKVTPPTFRHNVDYEGDTNYKDHGSENTRSGLSKEHENEEDKEFKDKTSDINDTYE